MTSKRLESIINPTAVQSTKENTVTKSYNFKETRDAQGRLVNVFVNPDAEKTFPITTKGYEEMENGKSALRAAVDFYRFGEFSHPFTVEGLHIYANADITTFAATNLGVVSSEYSGNFPVQLPENGWAQVNVRKNKYYLSKFTKAYDADRQRKHDFMDAFILGYGIDIRVLPWQVLAVDYMTTWKETDDAKAYERKYEGYKRSNARNFVNKEIAKAFRTGTSLPQLVGDVSGALILHLDKGEYVPLESLPLGRYKIYEGESPLTTVNWDGSVYAVSQLKMAAGKKNWGLKTL